MHLGLVIGHHELLDHGDKLFDEGAASPNGLLGNQSKPGFYEILSDLKASEVYKIGEIRVYG